MKNSRSIIDFSSRKEAANNLIEGLKINKETTEQAKKKMGSLISLSLRGYVMMRMLNNNFGYSFVLDKNVRRPQKGLAYFAIHRIYNNEMKLIFNEDDINLIGKEKKRYCQTRTLEIMMKCLENIGYKFFTISTKKAERENLSSYKNLTNVKIRRFELILNDNKYKFDMEMMENSLGMDEYKNVLNGFKGNVSHVILCNNNCSDKILNEMNLELNKVGIVYEKSNDRIEFSYITNEEQQSSKSNESNKTNKTNKLKQININDFNENNNNNKNDLINDQLENKNEERMTEINIEPSIQMTETNNQNNYNNYNNQNNSNQLEQLNLNNYNEMNLLNQLNQLNYYPMSESYYDASLQIDQPQTIIGYDYNYQQPIINNLLSTSIISNENNQNYQNQCNYFNQLSFINNCNGFNICYNNNYNNYNCNDQNYFDNNTCGINSEQFSGFMNCTQMDLNIIRNDGQVDTKTLTH